jgi:hypothetical protein
MGFMPACDSVDLGFLFVTPASSQATKTQTVTLSYGAKVVVNNNNGSTQIKVDSTATRVTIRITRIAFAQDETTADTLLDNIVVTINEPGSSNGALTIDAPTPAGATDDLNNFSEDLSDDEMDVTGILLAQQVAVVKLVITLPPGFDVEVTQKNGVVRATGLDAAGELTVENGTVKVLEATGDVTVRLTDGQIEVTDHEGSLDAAVENGAIEIGATSLGASETIKAAVTNGQITLGAPADIEADLVAEAEEGTVVFSQGDFDTVASLTQTLQSVTAVLNGGGPSIDLRARNGLIDIGGR